MATNFSLDKIKQTFGIGNSGNDNNMVTKVKQQFGLIQPNSFIPATGEKEAAQTANNSDTQASEIKKNLNPFLSKKGELVNPYINYSQLADDSRTSAQVKRYIQEATGINPTAQANAQTSSDANGTNGTESTTELSSWDAEKLKKTDLTQLPKLSEQQISTLIGQFFSGSGSVMKSSDAAGIYKAQSQSGISALALLGIGALESGWGTSNIAREKGNLWGWGAVNSNPMGGAKTYSSNAGEAAVESVLRLHLTHRITVWTSSITVWSFGE